MTCKDSIPPLLVRRLQPPTTLCCSAKSRSHSASRSRSRQTAAGRKKRGTPFGITHTAGFG